MKSIETKYVGPSNVRGSRIIATDCGDHRIIVSRECALSIDDAHKNAAITLANKLHWKGVMLGGYTKNGMVWIFPDNNLSFVAGEEATGA